MSINTLHSCLAYYLLGIRPRISSILVTSTITNMAGDGRCSILPKISMAGRLANATELPRNLIRGFSNI